MLDFSLINGGEEFEQLCEELLARKGVEISVKPSRGADFGADIIGVITVTDDIGISEKHRILIECKNFAKSNRSVREDDIGNIIERTIASNCNKYLLITTTTVSSVVAHQLKGITNNPAIPISASFWAKNDLDKFINDFPDIRERYFVKNKGERTTTKNSDPKVTLIVHSHPDFERGLSKMINLWNSQQRHISFKLIRPSREIETKLLSSGSISESDASNLADLMRSEAGFQRDDGIIQFCEKRLFGEGYFQLFASGTEYFEEPPNTATISLQFMRLLSQKKSADILGMIFQSIIHVISTGIGLEAHKETKGCIMDFDNNMQDILIGLKEGPIYCLSCEKQIKKTGTDYLLDLAKASKDFLGKLGNKDDTYLRMTMRDKRKEVSGENYDFDVALSFAGEDRDKAESLAIALNERAIKVFYDGFQKAELWGQDLYSYLFDLYRLRARYCVMFISRQYSEKLWTNHERKAAQERAFKENQAYILPIRVDNTEIPGVFSTVGYINWDKESVERIADMIIDKLSSE